MYPLTRPLKAALLGGSLLVAPACVLIGYEPHGIEGESKPNDAGHVWDVKVEARGPDAADGVDAKVWVSHDAAADARAEVDAAHDAEVGLDGAPDAQMDGALDAQADAASEDGAVDAQIVDGGPVEECPDGGCVCPPLGHVCAGDLWLTCDEQGRVVSSVNCQDLVTDLCQQGVCRAELGCTVEPAPDGTACDDGLFCTQLDVCEAGVCAGTQDPCASTVCVTQHCDEDNNACVIDNIHTGAACGPGSFCDADGSCVTSQNCTGDCKPVCQGTAANCDLTCNDAQSCDVTCNNRQTCDIDCQNTGSCTATCNDWFTLCDLDCAGATQCEGNCQGGGDCALDCEGTEHCDNRCAGLFSRCTTNCDNSADCSTQCGNLSRCEVSSCDNGRCSTTCDQSTCAVDCRNADSCVTACTAGSSCDIDCRGAGSCVVDCSFTSECRLRCSPGDRNCRFRTCWGGGATCRDGSIVCHESCL